MALNNVDALRTELLNQKAENKARALQTELAEYSGRGSGAEYGEAILDLLGMLRTGGSSERTIAVDVLADVVGAAADLAETLWQRPLSVAGELPPLCSAVAFLWRDTSGWAEQLGAATGVQKQWVAKEARQPWVVAEARQPWVAMETQEVVVSA